jgi:hypothetical protein
LEYLEWLEELWAAVRQPPDSNFGNNEVPSVSYSDIAISLGIGDTVGNGEGLSHDLRQAIEDGLLTLGELGLLNSDEQGFFTLTASGLLRAGQPLRNSWLSIFQPRLSAFETEFIMKLLELSVIVSGPRSYPRLVSRSVRASTVYKALGRGWDRATYAQALDMLEGLRGVQLLRDDDDVPAGDAYCTPTYNAFVWAARK